MQTANSSLILTKLSPTTRSSRGLREHRAGAGAWAGVSDVRSGLLTDKTELSKDQHICLSSLHTLQWRARAGLH